MVSSSNYTYRNYSKLKTITILNEEIKNVIRWNIDVRYSSTSQFN